MGYILFALFIGVPIMEISVFISVGEEIGVGSTIVIVILTAIIGTWLLRRQGLQTLYRLQEQLNHGQLPLREVFDGFCLLVAGAFLLTPGFVTDGVGFLLFIAPFRDMLRVGLGRFFARHGHIHVQGAGMNSEFREPFSNNTDDNSRADANRDWAGGRGPIIDGEFQDVTDGDSTDPQETNPDPVVRRIDK